MKQFLEAGKIVNTHGISGEVKVQSWCDAPEVLLDFDVLYFAPNKPIKVKSAYVHKGNVIMRLEGVNDCNTAETLREQILYLNRDDIDLPEDLVFIQDMIGLVVFDERTNEVIGSLRDVLTSNPAHDMYEISRPDGTVALVPACAPFLKSVDIESGRITICSIEGLI